MSSSERPDESVLDALERRTGELARVQLSGGLGEARRAFQSLTADAPQDRAASLARRQLEAARSELED